MRKSAAFATIKGEGGCPDEKYQVHRHASYLCVHEEAFCPHCKAALTVETAHHLVNSRSEEAKNYDFSTEDGRMIGTVDFRNPYFACPNCHAEFSVEELWKMEKGKRASR